MAPSLSFAFVAAAALLSGNAEAGLYPKSSAVLSITGKTYQSLIANSNYTSIVEFYAPWCGHCKNLQPAYEKAAKQLSGLAKVAAIDCDDEGNKPFCGSMGVQGFPTLKIVRPGKKPGKPIVEDYQGARTAKGIADAVLVGIQNHVKKVSDKDVEKFESESGAKAILFSDKGTTSATLKALAIDFLGSVSVAQVRDKEKATVEKYGVTKFPTLLVIPAGAEEPLTYSGEMKKDAMVKFITESTSISPNPDPAPEAAKKAKPPKGEKKSQKKFEQDSKAHKASDASSEKLKATSVVLDDEPTTSPDPAVETPKPVKVAETVNVLDVVETADDLHAKCLNPSAKICILVLLPHEEGQQALTEESSAKALLSASEVRHKLSGRGLFPFYAVKAENPLSAELRKELSLSDKVEVIATNAKRSWVRKYTKETYGVAELGEWVDAIKMNEGPKEKLPDSLIKEIEIKETKVEDPVAAPEPPSEPFIDALKEAAGKPKAAEPEPQQVPIKEGGEKYVVHDGDVMIEVEEVDDDFEIPVPTRDEL